MFAPSGIINILLAIVLAPMMPGIINRTKAAFAGRRGQPWLQLYYELWKLVQKSAVYSSTTTPVFLLGPIVGCSATIIALAFIPMAGQPSFVSFTGDFLLVAYFLGLTRFCTIVSALDTGSSFEGMGASREAFFSAIAETALLLSLTTLAVLSRQTSLSGMYASLGAVPSSTVGPAVMLVILAMMVVFLAENARIPVDDPNTHLELTMIHEAMVLDHSGPDFAMIQYGASLKLWILGSLLSGMITPMHSGWFIVDIASGLVAMGLLAVVTGIVESTMARLRLLRVPQFLIAASILAIVALILVMR
jgi:formate hydrogenlyase subunit 4